MKKIVLIFLLCLFYVNNAYPMDIEFKVPVNKRNIKSDDTLSDIINKKELKNQRVILDSNIKKIVSRTLETEIQYCLKKSDYSYCIQSLFDNIFYKINTNSNWKLRNCIDKIFDLFEILYTKNIVCFGHYPKFDYSKSDFKTCLKDKKLNNFETERIDKIVLYYFLYNSYIKYYESDLYKSDKDLLKRLKDTDVYYSDVNDLYLFPFYTTFNTEIDNYLSSVKNKLSSYNNINDKTKYIEDVIFNRIRYLTDNNNFKDKEIKTMLNEIKILIYDFVENLYFDANKEELEEKQSELYFNFMSDYLLYVIVELKNSLPFSCDKDIDKINCNDI